MTTNETEHPTTAARIAAILHSDHVVNVMRRGIEYSISATEDGNVYGWRNPGEEDDEAATPCFGETEGDDSDDYTAAAEEIEAWLNLPVLSFAALRAANVARLPLFKNSHGEPAHSEPDGSDWSLGEWCTAVTGELGEAANLIKKVKRGDLSMVRARPLLAKEFADVVTYLDILAFRAGIDLGDVTAAKWDEVSARIEIPLRINDFNRRDP